MGENNDYYNIIDCINNLRGSIYWIYIMGKARREKKRTVTML